MSFRKPFRAVPIKLGARYRRKQQIGVQKAALNYLGIAVAAGAIIGTGSVALGEGGSARIFEAVKPIGVRAGIVRAREPQAGDFWGGCDDARAAGTAPIYFGEPGYREEMDGDGDGLACEPYHGR
jgi:hypothetical protein